MQVVTEPLKDLLQWATDRLPGVPVFAPESSAALGICRDGKLACVVVYSNIKLWSDGGHAEVSFAADTPRWATREAVALLLGTGFYTLGLSRLTARIEKRHKRSRKLVEGLGFEREGALKEATPEGRTVILYRLLRREFEEGKYVGQRQRNAGRKSAEPDPAAGGTEPPDGLHATG